MNTILISYDLCEPGKDYSLLWKHIKSYGNYAKILESVWLIRTSYSTEQVRDYVVEYVDSNDKIFVVDVTRKESAWKNLPINIAEWIGPEL